jgi:hypothetical protein
VDRYTLLRATSSTERQCATIDNKGGGEGVRERFVLGGPSLIADRITVHVKSEVQISSNLLLAIAIVPDLI